MRMGMKLWILDIGNERWVWCECIWDGFAEFGATHSVGVKGMVDWTSMLVTGIRFRSLLVTEFSKLRTTCFYSLS
jgi:hypothetical protein